MDERRVSFTIPIMRMDVPDIDGNVYLDPGQNPTVAGGRVAFETDLVCPVIGYVFALGTRFRSDLVIAHAWLDQTAGAEMRRLIQAGINLGIRPILTNTETERNATGGYTTKTWTLANLVLSAIKPSKWADLAINPTEWIIT